MRPFWPKKPDLLSLFLPTLQGYNIQQGEVGEWWICQDGQVWACLSNSSGQWCLEIILEEKDIPQVNTLLVLTSVFRKTCGFAIGSSTTSKLYERKITGKRAALAALSP